MDVKQEHFYVPYNVVWKNWDKFISGGEKMDYKGIVPNTCMHDILMHIVSVFDLSGISIIPTNTGGENSLSFPASLNVARNMLLNVDRVAEEYHIKDLLAPQYEVIKKIHDFDLTNDVYPNPYDFVLVTTPSIDQAAREQTFINYLSAQNLTGNKYLEEIKPYILEVMETNSSIWLPTLQGFDKMVLFYEFVKPLCGLGSNIDYLNMGRLTLAELILMQSLSITRDYLDYKGPFAGFATQLDLGYRQASQLPMTILHLRANYSVWYNNYRDILLEADAFEPQDDDSVSLSEIFTLLIPRQRCWEKDSFTTALDNPGTGNVGVPVGAQGANFGGYVYQVQKPSEIDTDQLDGNDIYEVNIDGHSWQLPTSFLGGINSRDVSDEPASMSGFSLYQLDAAQRAQKWLQKPCILVIVLAISTIFVLVYVT